MVYYATFYSSTNIEYTMKTSGNTVLITGVYISIGLCKYLQ